jgi:hypothetical protein
VNRVAALLERRGGQEAPPLSVSPQDAHLNIPSMPHSRASAWLRASDLSP